MKKFLYLMAALAIFAVSCTKPEPVKPSITLTSPADVTVPTDGGIQTISFNSNVPWTVTIDNSNWSVTPTSGEAGTATVKVTVPNNTTEDPIVGKVTIKAETVSQVVTLTQLQKDAMVVDVTSYDAPAEGGKISVKVKANVEVTATTEASWLKIATATKSMVEKSFDVEVSANDGEAREGTIILSGAGKKVEVTVKQAAFEPYFEVDCDYFEVTKAGGDFTVNVTSNVEWTMKDYHDSTQPFLTAEATKDGNNAVVKINISANEGYFPRRPYVKFTIPDIIDEETGEAKVVRVYLNQQGTATLAWQKSLTSYGNVVTVSGIHRLAYCQGILVLSDGTNMHMIEDSTGDIRMSEECPFANTAVDDAGNLLLAPETPFMGTLELKYMTLGGEEGVLLTYEHNSIYSSTLSNIRVKGDIFGDALVVAFTDLYPYAVCWEIKNGIVQDPQQIALPSIANWDTYSGIVWSSSRNGCVVPVGTSLADGLLYMAYDGRYVLTHIAADGTATDIYTPYDDPASEGGNENFNCISTTVWDGEYIVAFEKGQFFSYGNCPDLYILNQAANKVDNLDHNLIGISTTYLGVDDGENASGDILLQVTPEGNLSIYVVDALADVIYKVVVPKK